MEILEDFACWVIFRKYLPISDMAANHTEANFNRQVLFANFTKQETFVKSFKGFKFILRYCSICLLLICYVVCMYVSTLRIFVSAHIGRGLTRTCTTLYNMFIFYESDFNISCHIQLYGSLSIQNMHCQHCFALNAI